MVVHDDVMLIVHTFSEIRILTMIDTVWQEMFLVGGGGGGG